MPVFVIITTYLIKLYGILLLLVTDTPTSFSLNIELRFIKLAFLAAAAFSKPHYLYSL